MKRRRKNLMKRNRPFYMVVFLIGIYVLWIFMDQQMKLAQFTTQEEGLKERIKELKIEEVRLEEEKGLGDDPKYIEKIAREKLKMVKPNEMIYIDQGKEKDHP